MKKKILAITLAICIAAITISTASLAYFTDKKTVDNVFTVGDVTIKLDESKVSLDESNHAVVSETERTSDDQDYGSLYPGQTVKKDPCITNTGSENAYVAAKVTISATNGITEDNQHLVENLLSGKLLNEDVNATVVCALDKENHVYVIYILYHNEMGKDYTVTLFDILSIPGTYGNTEMQALNGLNIRVEAYAAQSAGFTSAQEALLAAFPTELAALAPSTN